jgi:hypothetical protein
MTQPHLLLSMRQRERNYTQRRFAYCFNQIEALLEQDFDGTTLKRMLIYSSVTPLPIILRDPYRASRSSCERSVTQDFNLHGKQTVQQYTVHNPRRTLPMKNEEKNLPTRCFTN